VEKVGLSVEQVHQAQENALQVCFLSETEKQAQLTKLDKS
jgi:adenosine deaminase